MIEEFLAKMQQIYHDVDIGVIKFVEVILDPKPEGFNEKLLSILY